MRVLLQFPDVGSLKIRLNALGKQEIWDCFRKKYVALSPEEWVRQVFLLYLTQTLKYPKGLISVEKGLLVNGLKKRYDIVVFDPDLKPWLLVECKEPNVTISENTLMQIVTYQNAIQAKFWVLTNGADTFCAAIENGRIEWLNFIPTYNF